VELSRPCTAWSTPSEISQLWAAGRSSYVPAQRGRTAVTRALRHRLAVPKVITLAASGQPGIAAVGQIRLTVVTAGRKNQQGGAIARTRSPSPCRATTTPTVPRGPQRSAAAARLPHCNRQDADPARSVTSTRTMPSPTLTATVILSPGTAVARFVPIGSLLRETIQGGDTWTR
jgi:hypothetical protein